MLQNIHNLKEVQKKILIRSPPVPDQHQHVIGSFLTHSTSFHQVVW